MVICSVAEGTAEALDNIPDEMFAQRVMGDGVAVRSREEWLYSPVDGRVTMIFETKHALGIQCEDGTELLIHIGVDTVNMKGAPFALYVGAGEKVRTGDLLMYADFRQIEESGYCPLVMMIVTNKKVTVLKDHGEVKKGDPLLEVTAGKEAGKYV